MSRLSSTAHAAGLLLLLGCLGCASVRTSLSQADELYQQARYEAALAWLVDAEADTARMKPPDRVRFYYLRGMTAYRLAQRDDALHFLALAAAADQEHPLEGRERSVMHMALDELTPREASHHARNPLRPETL